MSQPYSSKDIDQIEEEFKALDLESEEVEIVKKSITVEIIENDENDDSSSSIQIVKKPTKVEFIENEP